MTLFTRYIGIDYSGAETPEASLKGLRVYVAEGEEPPVEQQRPKPATSTLNPKKYWTRKDIAAWLVDQLRRDVPTIVGIDHGFSFPMKYFKRHRLSGGWAEFLDDFQAHWPTDADYTYVDFIRDDIRGRGNAKARTGSSTWRRRTEERVRGKSVFHFDVQGQVAKSTHAGLPWLRFIRRELGERVHFWPFDGWEIPAGRSVILEVYPRLWKDALPVADLTDDQRDARAVACWLQRADRNGELRAALSPSLKPEDRALAAVEGWILTSERYELPVPKREKRSKSIEAGPSTGMSLANVSAMPEISRFFGIVIRMFYKEHGTPHFHADYGSYRASIDIESGAIRGELPPRALGLVLEWRAIHRAELLDAWQAARDQRPLPPIAPLE